MSIFDAGERRTLAFLDALVSRAPARRALDAIADRLERRLAAAAAPLLVWEPVELALYAEPLPAGILSSWVFALRANAVSGPERHPNSIQRVMSYRGSADLQTRPADKWLSHRLVSGRAAPLENRWLSIPAGVWHQGAMGDENWTVVSFHTVPAEELIEERPAAAGAGVARRHYVA